MKVEIRAWKLEDAEALAQVLNNPKIHDNLRDGWPLPYTALHAKGFISAVLAADGGDLFMWAITADGAVVGNVGADRKENVHRLTAELGYYIAEEYWGKGIATNAVKQACDFLFANTDIVRIFAESFSFNAASCRVLEKAGFAYEGTLRKNAVKNGKIVDMKMYALVRD